MKNIFLIYIILTPFFLSAQVNVQFIADKTENCGGMQVQFTDLSSSTAGEIVFWKWDLAGNTSTLQNPGKIFSNAGSYTICLTVKDDKGNEGIKCKEDYITIHHIPSPSFSLDQKIGCEPLEVTFTDLSLSNNGDIVHWIWGVGGSKGVVDQFNNSSTFSNIYSQSDNYSVSLTIIDEEGCENTVYYQDIIQVIPSPEINIGTLDPIPCVWPIEIDFENYGSGGSVQYNWSLGNGTEFEGYDPPATVYDQAGDYTVSVTAIDTISGCTNEIVLEDYISPSGSASFDFSPQEGCGSLEVEFSDLSLGLADSLFWDFGDGGSSSLSYPNHIYQNPGVYTVTLTRYMNGCESVLVHPVQIIVNEGPIIPDTLNFPGSCVVPAEIDFFVPGDPDYQYSWNVLNIGGGLIEFKEGQSTTFEFDSYGQYPILLHVTDDKGCTVSKFVDTILLQDFNINMFGHREGCVPAKIGLNISSNMDVPFTNVEWTVFTNPKQIFNTESANFILEEVGRFDVQLIVENELGCIDTIYKVDYVRGGIKPEANFEGFPLVVCPGEPVQFTDLSIGNVDDWLWTFSDTAQTDIQNPLHVFNEPGFYDIGLTASYNGCEDFILFEDYVEVLAPGNRREVTYNCENPYEVEFVAICTQADSFVWFIDDGVNPPYYSNEDTFSYVFPGRGKFAVELTSYSFVTGCVNPKVDTVLITDPEANFYLDPLKVCAPYSTIPIENSIDVVDWKYFVPGGDVSQDHVPNPSLIFKNPGIYTDMLLIVKDEKGCESTYQYPDTLWVNQAYAKAKPIPPVCVGEPFEFINESYDYFGNIIFWEWKVEDTLLITQDQNLSFLFDTLGHFDFTLYVEDDWGCKATLYGNDWIKTTQPYLDLLADTLSCTWNAVEFENGLHSSTYTYEWDFGDGTQSTEPDPVHLYKNEGIYDICLKATDQYGCVNEICLPEYVQIMDPIAAFTVPTYEADCPPLLIDFTNLSQNAFYYTWDFGDNGGGSSEFQPSHIYTQPGSYSVQLIAKHIPECQDTSFIADLIVLDGPTGNFSYEILEPCLPMEVQFNAITEEPYQLIWDYGNGLLDSVPGLNDSDLNTYIYNEQGIFTPALSMVDKNGCVITVQADPLTVHVLEANFEAFDTLKCEGFDIPVSFVDDSYSSNGIINYSWNFPDANPPNSSDPNPTAFYESAGLYDVYLIIDNGICIDTLYKEELINVRDLPQLNVEADSFVCYNDTIQLLAKSKDSKVDFLWDENIPGLTNYYIPNPKAFTTDSKYFVVEGIDEFGCKSLDSIFVNVIDDHTPLMPDQAICLGDTINISIEYGENPQWLVYSNIDCTQCSDVNASPEENFEYLIEVTNSYGCKVRDSFNIEVVDPVSIDAGNPQTICYGDEIVLAGEGIGSPTWSPSENLQSPYSYITKTTALESGYYFLQTNYGSCTLNDSVYIEVIPDIQIEAVGDSICPGEPAILLASGDAEYYKWSVINTPLIPDGTMVMVQTDESQTISVHGELGSCKEDTAFAQILVYDEVDASLIKERTHFKDIPVKVDLDVPDNNNYSYNWSPSDGVNCPTCEDVIITPGFFDKYQVIVTDEVTGCIDSFDIKIRQISTCVQSSDNLGIPNVFSPNGDGVNDYISLYAPAFEEIRYFNVFTRWGELVYSSKEFDFQWDGTHKGVMLNPGVYAYILAAVCPDNGQTVYKHGDITVLR